MPPRFPNSPRRPFRRGNVLIYMTGGFTVMVGIASLALDLARVRSIKAEMQASADAIALSTIGAYIEQGMTAAQTAANTYAAANPVDRSSGVAPTFTFVGGTWDLATRAFTPNGSTGYPAVKVTVSRTRANNNPILLPLASAIGMGRCDAQASAIAAVIDNQTAAYGVNSTANSYFAGMPSGSSNSWGDNTANAAPNQVITIPVVPGTWISIAGATGTTSIVPGTTPYVGPDGEATRPLHHGQNQDGSDWGIGPENGIADAVLPAAALTGLFLNDNAPTVGPVSSAVDWTNPAIADRAAINTLQLKAPFLLGSGKTSGGATKKFQVPPGATRLYLSIWDGVTSSNNGGSLSVTLKLQRSIRLVK